MRHSSLAANSTSLLSLTTRNEIVFMRMVMLHKITYFWIEFFLCRVTKACKQPHGNLATHTQQVRCIGLCPLNVKNSISLLTMAPFSPVWCLHDSIVFLVAATNSLIRSEHPGHQNCILVDIVQLPSAPLASVWACSKISKGVRIRTPWLFVRAHGAVAALLWQVSSWHPHGGACRCPCFDYFLMKRTQSI